MRPYRTISLLLGALLAMACGPGDPCRESCLSSEQCGSGKSCVAQCCVERPDMGCVPTGADETCDGIDDDCDGTADEAYVEDSTCGLGACRMGNTPSACSDGVISPCRAGDPTGDETCDGRDEDCNGVVDDVEGAGDACTVGIGLCVARGRLACAGGGDLACSAMPGDPLPDDRQCDGIDSDCDGDADEGYVAQYGMACEGALGACATESVVDCVDGGEICRPGDPTEEACNVIDDDCDGRHDEQEAVWGEPTYLPFARQVVGESRRAVRANMAWNDNALAIVWSENAIGAEAESSQGALTVIDAAGRALLDPATRLIDDVPITSPYIARDGDRWLIAWTDFADDFVKYTFTPDGRLAEPTVSLYGGTNGNLRAVVEGPAGPLLAWYAFTDGTGGATFEEWIGQPAADPASRGQRLTNNILADRTARLAAAPDRIGIAWTRNEYGGGRTLRFRLTDPVGRPLSEEIEVGEVGPVEVEDADAGSTIEHDITWTGRGFMVTWVASEGGDRRLRTRLIGRDGRALQGVRAYDRAGIRSRNLPSLWIAELESTAVAWSEDIGETARIHVGLIDPFTGELIRVEVLPESGGQQLNPSDLAWSDGRLAVVWEEKRADDDWRPAISFGAIGCGRERCQDGPQPLPDGICDGVDADCDGALDEDYVAVEACGVGRCRLESEASACRDGFEVYCQPASPVDEVCGNDLDDDCDQRTDEGCNGCPDGTTIPTGWVCIPSGEFTMGSPIGESHRWAEF